MTDELKTAIEVLYNTFSIYPSPFDMNSCPCCISIDDKKKIHSKPLYQLDSEDLDRYTFKAITTWGNTNDFKHFLPRIFELLATGSLMINTSVVLNKLDYGKWTNWNNEEQQAIQNFLLEWWADIIKNKSYFDTEDFVEIYKLLGNLKLMLNRWEISYDNYSFKHLIYLIEYDFDDLINSTGSFKNFGANFKNDLLKWLFDKKNIIENGFFYFEKTNSEFTENISNALFIIEHST